MENTMEFKHQLIDNLKSLRLSGILETLDTRLTEASESNQGYLEFLSLVIGDEVDKRGASRLKKRIRTANFGEEKTFEQFDFRFNELDLPRAQLKDLSTCRFLDLKQNLVLCGPPGIGKTHIAKAIGHEACRRKYSVAFTKVHSFFKELQNVTDKKRYDKIWKKYLYANLLILDDFGFRKITGHEAELFYDLIDNRLGNGSILITSNRPISDWLSLFPDPVIAGAILDRLVSDSMKLIISKAKSFRKEGRQKSS
jgi:DNA replication protein DnaC